MNLNITAFLLLLLFSFTVQAQEKKRDIEVIVCEQFKFLKPTTGRSYQGFVSNEDYAFSAKIPEGLKGWDGADESAPFHGFTIPLDSRASMCINVEIHIQVDEENTQQLSGRAKPIKLGEMLAWQSRFENKIGKTNITNIKTSFSSKHLDHIDEVEVLLIAPSSQLLSARKRYDAFLRSLRFH